MNGYGRWGYITLALVVFGALQVVQGQDNGSSGNWNDARVPSLEHARPDATMAQMRDAFEVMKANGFDPMRLPLNLLRSPDHHLGEYAMSRDPKSTTYAVPSDEAHKELAMYTGLYHRRNIKVIDGRSESRPYGYFLVMFRDGRLEKIEGKDIRLITSKSTDEAIQELCFPTMACYRENLPRMPEYQDPWYKGPPLD